MADPRQAPGPQMTGKEMTCCEWCGATCKALRFCRNRYQAKDRHDQARRPVHDLGAVLRFRLMRGRFVTETAYGVPMILPLDAGDPQPDAA